MYSPAEDPTTERSSNPINVSCRDLRLHLLQVAGDNPAFAAKLREMIWQDYCGAGQPFGPSEDGMLVWIAHDRQGFRQ